MARKKLSLSDKELQEIADNAINEMVDEFGGDLKNFPEDSGILFGGKKRENKGTSESEKAQH